MAPEAAPEASTAAPQRALRPWMLALIGVVGVLGLTLMLAAGLAQSLRTESGTRWLLKNWAGLSVEQPRGALWGDFGAQRIQWTQGDTHIDIRGLAWQGLRLQMDRAPGVWLRLRMVSLHAQEVTLQLESKPRTQAPRHLQLPISWDLTQLSVGKLTLVSPEKTAHSSTTFSDLQARLHLGAQQGQAHELQEFQFTWGHLKAQGHAQIMTAAPMKITMALAAQPRAVANDPTQPTSLQAIVVPWEAQLIMSGALASPVLQATLRGDSRAPRPPHLRLAATLSPWAAWPLSELTGEISDIDLAAFHPQAPHTALRGTLAQTPGAEQLAAINVQVNNDAAGPWSQQLLPVHHLSLSLGARPDKMSLIKLDALRLDWGTQEHPGGHVVGQGHASQGQWALDLAWHDLRPATLDERAPAMRLSGPMRVSGQGPQWQAESDLQGQLLPAATSSLRPGQGQNLVRLQVKGGMTPATAASASAPAQAETWTLKTLEAQLGKAKLSATGLAKRRPAQGEWELQAQTQWHHFDPLPWWPGPAGSIWREGGHRLNGEASAEISTMGKLSPDAPDAPVAKSSRWLNHWQGRVGLKLNESQLAGVPWNVEATLQKTQGMAHLQLMAQAAGNSVRIDGAWPGTPTAPTTLKINAPDLSLLNPWGSLMKPRASKVELRGQLQGHLTLIQTGSELRTQGQLNAANVQWGKQHLSNLQAQWELGDLPSSQLQLQLQINKARWQGRQLANLVLQAKGRVDEHLLSLQAQLDALPPIWFDELRQLNTQDQAQVQNSQPQHTTLRFTAQGSLGGATEHKNFKLPTGWQGQITEWSARSEPAPRQPPWWEGQAVNVALDWGTPITPQLGLRISASQGQWAGSTLRWGPIQWQTTPTGEHQIDAEISLDPIAIAPMLARLQPDVGWRGDLHVGLQAKIHSHPHGQADVVLERHHGDLQITDETGTRALVLSTLRLALNAMDGRWTFTQAVAGQNLGVISGALVAQTSPGTRWPQASTPVQGVLELQVAELGAWGTWLPAGWRLGGQLRASAGLAGTWSTPQFTGAIHGTGLSARHVLKGVSITDGKVDIMLDGDTAQINNISARSGSGTLVLQGQAQLGPAPTAQLNMELDRFQLLGRVDRRLIASGQSLITLSSEALDLSGQWKIDEGLIDFSRGDAPSLASDVQVVRTLLPTDPTLPSQALMPPALRARSLPLHINLNVELGRQLKLKGRGLDTALKGALKVHSMGQGLQVHGIVQTEGGSYKAYGQKLSVDRGMVIFTGDVNNPRLDIEATRPDTGEVRVGMLITGNAGNPRVRLFSDPEMSDIDKLSWLVLGRPSDGLGGTDIALLQRAAVALLSGENEGLTDQFFRLIGLDQLSVRQNDGAVKETIVSVSRQLSQRWSIGYERSLNATEGSWQLIYRLAQRFTLRAQTGQENAADFIWSWRWD